MSGLRLEAARKSFGSVRALDGVSLSAEAGEFVVLLGPSGSGKTTLLRALAGLEGLDEGRIWLGERLVEDASAGLRLPPEARGLGMVFQEYALWPHLSALENVALPLRERRVADWRARALEALEGVGLGGHTTRFAFELSGGQQQRVALARALAGRPAVLLFDEPLSNLDAQLRDELRLEIARLTRAHGITGVYITHDQSEAFFLADRLGVMSQGKLVQFDRPERVYETPATYFVAQFTGALGGLKAEVSGSELRFGNLHLPLSADPTRPQGRVRVALRPEGLTVYREPQPNSLEVALLHCAYSGSHYQVWLGLPDGQRLLAHTEERLVNLERVWVTLDPARVLVFNWDVGAVS